MEDSISSLVGLSNSASAPLGLVPAIEISVLAGALLAIVFFRCKQPPLLAYIVAGLMLGFFTNQAMGASLAGMEEISHLGLIFLLFIIGLELDLKGIFKLGPKTAACVLLQAPVAVAAVYALQRLASGAGYTIIGLAFSPQGFLYFSVAVSLSSTAVVVKLLADKFDLGSKAGKVTVLTLIAQDIWAVLALSFLSSQNGAAAHGWLGVPVMIGQTALLAFLMYFAAKFAVSRAMTFLATSPDLMALTALGWCFFGTTVMSWVGLSPEMGALLAGLTIGSLPGAPEILSKVVSLRDFFMAIFFISLGMSLPPPTVEVLIAASMLVLITILARFLLFTPTLLVAGLGPIISLVAPLNLAQLSEFSLLLVPIGVSAGALTVHEGSVISYAMMLSVVFTTYGIKYNYQFAQFAERVIHRPGPFSAKTPPQPLEPMSTPPRAMHTAEIILLGYHANAEALIRRIRADRPEWMERILVIDYNLENHSEIAAQGVAVAYGDISNPETLRRYGIDKAAVVLSTVSDAFLRGTSNEELIATIKALSPKARLIATILDSEKGDDFLRRGVFACVCPPAMAAPEFIRHIECALAPTETS